MAHRHAARCALHAPATVCEATLLGEGSGLGRGQTRLGEHGAHLLCQEVAHILLRNAEAPRTQCGLTMLDGGGGLAILHQRDACIVVVATRALLEREGGAHLRHRLLAIAKRPWRHCVEAAHVAVANACSRVREGPHAV